MLLFVVTNFKSPPNVKAPYVWVPADDISFELIIVVPVLLNVPNPLIGLMNVVVPEPELIVKSLLFPVSAASCVKLIAWLPEVSDKSPAKDMAPEKVWVPLVVIDPPNV